MADVFTLSFRPGIAFTLQRDRLTLQFAQHCLTLDHPKPGLRSALEQLKHSARTISQLTAVVAELDGVEDGVKFEADLQKLIRLGWICHSVLPLATAIPIAATYGLIDSTIDWQRPLTLSRFAFLHRENQEFVLESALSKAKIILLDWRVTALIAKLAETRSPLTTERLTETFIEADAARRMFQLLIATQMATLGPESDSLTEWQFHNLLFHRQTRAQRLDEPLRSQPPLFEERDRSSVLKAPMNGRVIALQKPDLAAIARADCSLTQAIETRQSIREYDDQPIAIHTLGEFLYRCARAKEVYTPDIDPSNVGERTKRPYPCGGALYELEIYLVINRCEGLESGLYHYQPLGHTLHLLSEWNPDVDALIQDAWNATGRSDIPQVLLIVTARFGRLFWRYHAIGYGLILKHIGVLYQTFYLVATAMKLAPCAIGAGNSEQFCKIANLNEYEESSVGEFMIGSLKRQRVGSMNYHG